MECQQHDPTLTGQATVPVLWDKRTQRIVNTGSSELIRTLGSAFEAITGGWVDLNPEQLCSEVDRWNAIIYPGLNNGVYRAGFAHSQTAY